MKIAGTRPKGAKLGLPGYARALCRIKHEPATQVQLMEEGYIGSYERSHIVLAALHRYQRIHISEWQEEPHCPLRAVWAYGSGDDAEPPKVRRGMRAKYRPGKAYIPTAGALPPSLLCFESLLSALESPCTIQRLIERTELSENTVRRAMRALDPLLCVVGRTGTACLWQLRDAAAGKPQRPRLGDALPRVSSVFHLAQVEREMECAT